MRPWRTCPVNHHLDLFHCYVVLPVMKTCSVNHHLDLFHCYVVLPVMKTCPVNHHLDLFHCYVVLPVMKTCSVNHHLDLCRCRVVLPLTIFFCPSRCSQWVCSGPYHCCTSTASTELYASASERIRNDRRRRHTSIGSPSMFVYKESPAALFACTVNEHTFTT